MWYYNNELFELTPEEYQGFVYQITELHTNKKYIGKKNFWKPKKYWSGYSQSTRRNGGGFLPAFLASKTAGIVGRLSKQEGNALSCQTAGSCPEPVGTDSSNPFLFQRLGPFLLDQEIEFRTNKAA